MDALATRPGAGLTIATPAFPDNGRTVFNGHLFVGRRAAERERHAEPSADADARRQPRARAAGADAGAAWAWWITVACARVPRPSARGIAKLRTRRRRAWRSWMRSTTTTCVGLRRRCRQATCHCSVGPRHRPARELRHCAVRPRERVARGARRTRDHRRQLLAGDEAPSRGIHRGRRGRVGDRSATHRGGRGCRRRRDRMVGAPVDRRPGAGVLDGRRQRRRRRAGASRRGERGRAAGAHARGNRTRAGRAGRGPAGRRRWRNRRRVRRRRWVLRELRIGPQIDPGVPWCFAMPSATRHTGLHLALKSGNFGADDFFTRAFKMLQ